MRSYLANMISPNRTKSILKRRIVSAVFIIVVIVILLTIRLVEDIGQEQKPGERFVVARVIDGDTVELKGGDRLRLLAVDTPEKGEPFHDQATRLLSAFSMGKAGRIEFAKTRRDRYGRMLGFLYVDDTLFVNRLIIDSGLGYLYLFDDQELNLPQIAEMLSAQRRAIGSKRGIWNIKQEYEDFYIASRKAHRFHRPGCKSISGLNEADKRIFKTKNQALFEGLSPCRNCHP